MNKKFFLRHLLPICVTVLGATAMLGELLRADTLKGLGLMSAAAPYPKVFCESQGIEGFAADFTLLLETEDGQEHAIPLTPELYSRLTGSYNRRNVYGAAISFAPRLPEELWRSVVAYGLDADGPLARELGLPSPIRRAEIIIQSKTSGREETWRFVHPAEEQR